MFQLLKLGIIFQLFDFFIHTLCISTLVHRRILEYLERSPRRIRHVRSVSSSQCSVDHLPPPASTLGMDLGWHGVAWLCVWGAGQLNDTCTILRSWGTKWKRWDATVECMTILPLDTESTPVKKWEIFGFATLRNLPHMARGSLEGDMWRVLEGWLFPETKVVKKVWCLKPGGQMENKIK